MSVTFRYPSAPSFDVEQQCPACDGSGTYTDGPCVYCDGTGTETVQQSLAPELNLADTNAAALCRLLDLPEEGSLPPAALPELRSKIALLSMRPQRLTRPTVEEGNTVYIGRSPEYVRDRLDRFSHVVDFGIASGLVLHWGK